MTSTRASKINSTAHHPRWIVLCLTAGLVFLAAWGAIELSRGSGRIAAIWIANAILLAAVLRSRHEDWSAIFAAGAAGILFANLAVGDSLVIATTFGVSNLLEVLAVAIPLRCLALERDFSRPRSLLAFYGLAIGPAPFLSALLCAVALHLQSGADMITIGLNWYASDAVGLVLVVPVLMTTRRDDIVAMFRAEQVTNTLLLFGGVAAAILINALVPRQPLAFLFYPAVLLLTFQRGFAGGALGLLFVGIFMTMPPLFGHPSGVLGTYDLREQLTIVQVFLAVIGFSVILVGAALEERRKLERGLAAAIAHAENSREEAIVAKDAAENASRMKSAFLATMSHELRTPLNAVLGFSDFMHNEIYGPLGNPQYREYAKLIHGAGSHLLDLINDILDMSKIEAGKHELNREPVDIALVVNDCLELMAGRAEQAGVTLHRDLPPKLLPLIADPRAMKQILINLLSNAIKFTLPGGDVTVGVTVRNANLVLSVRDTGIGIPSDKLHLLGNPFVQIRHSTGATHAGTGLGLALVRALAQMHNGSFRIESIEHAGTTVIIDIPLLQQAVLAA